MVRIRFATDGDRAGIFGVHESAFGKQQGPEIVDLVSGLLGDRTAMPVFSLVAEIGGRVVGHVLFTAVRLQSGPQSISAQILAPLAVSKEHQGEGIGGSLINEGLKQLAASGVELVFVLGDPDYYRKFGFRPAKVLGYEAPYPNTRRARGCVDGSGIEGGHPRRGAGKDSVRQDTRSTSALARMMPANAYFRAGQYVLSVRQIRAGSS